MKILLVRPKMANTLGFLNIVDCEPLELEYLSAVARERGVAPVIYDAMFDPADLREVVKRERPDAVAISGCITQENLMKKYARVIKEMNAATTVILGGLHAELNAERFHDSRADYILHTGSLEAFGDLLDALAGKPGARPDEIPGLGRKVSGEWLKTAALPCDPNAWPMPDRTFFEKTRHRYRYLEFSPCALLKASYSCPYSCNFCYCRKLNGGRYAERDMEKVVNEIETIPCDNIHIVDDDFLVNDERLEEFMALLKKKNIRKNYLVYGRADYISRNKDMILKLKEVGVRYMLVGLEAVADDRLAGYGKGTSLGQNERCVSVLRECGVNCMALLIVGLDFTKEDFARLRRWLLDMDLTYISIAIFTPLPGTDVYEAYRGRLTETGVEKFDFLHVLAEPDHMTKREFYIEYYRLFLSIYKIARRKNAYRFLDLGHIKKIFANYIRTALKT